MGFRFLSALLLGCHRFIPYDIIDSWPEKTTQLCSESIGYLHGHGMFKVTLSMPADSQHMIIAKIFFSLLCTDTPVNYWHAVPWDIPRSHDPLQHDPTLKFLMKPVHTVSNLSVHV
jgi:hypothetical protein